MNKSFRLFIIVVLPITILSVSFAQIPNANFESWTSGNPDNWYAANTGVTTVTQTTTAHTGSYALRGIVSTFYTMIVPPVIQTGNDAEGFPYSQRPVSVTGYYQFYPASSSGDRFYVDAGLYKGGADGTPIAMGAVAISSTASSYTKFTATFTYLTTDIPDTCIIQISIVGPSSTSTTPTVGSYYLLDDLAFESTTNIGEQQLSLPKITRLNQNYPNPFNPTTTFSFTLAQDGFTTLKIYNVLGKEVATLVNGDMKAGITNTVTFDASKLSSGVYFSRLENNGSAQIKKLVLMK
jgi:hypothetical protein